MTDELSHNYSVFIKATPQQVWEALTDPRFTTQYNFGNAAKGDWRTGSHYAMTSADGATVKYDGTVLLSDPPRQLVQTVNIKFDPAHVGHREMEISWDVEQFGETCQVTITHRAFESEAQLFEMLTGHCPHLMSGLKTLLETGQPLHIGQRTTVLA